jgi:hypothetical protein
MKQVLFGLITACVFVGSACAGEAKVSWQELEKFTDIRAANESQQGFQARIIKEFDLIFVDLAKSLPDGYLLEVNVTDLDLAGEVNIANRDLRVVKSVSLPRMRFTYTLKNDGNEVLASGKESLKDMGFMSGSRTPSSMSSFPYEEKMLHDWFVRQQRTKIFPK